MNDKLDLVNMDTQVGILFWAVKRAEENDSSLLFLAS